MHLSIKKKLSAMAVLAAVSIGIGNGAVFADSLGQHSGESQMNHEQMMNSDEEQMPMQQCSDNPNAEMNHEQMMNPDEEQMSIQQCSDNPNAEMNHEQMMNSDEEQIPMPNDAPSTEE